MSNSNEFVVSVRVQANAQQHNAEFAGAGSAVQAFAATARSGTDQVTASMQAVTGQAKHLGEATAAGSSQAAKGLAAVDNSAQALGGSFQAVTAQGQQAGQGLDRLTQATKATQESQAQAAAAGAQFLAMLREHIATGGKSTEELLRYRAAQAGVAAEAAPLILQWQNQRAAQQAAAEAAREETAAQRAAAAEKQQLAADQARFLAGLREQAEMQGKSSLELMRHRAAQLGVSDSAAKYIQSIEEASKANGRGTISAGQHAAAMRMLPAQITDVVTSVASGMPIWMVAIQQGGQVKDSFGGAGNALRAIVGSITPAVAGFATLAAGAGAVALAYYQGSSEADRYREAIVMSGSAAGVTVEQLGRMAREVDAIAGTQARASEGLALMARSGKIAGDGMVEFTAMAIKMEDATGKAVSKTVAELEELGKKPAEASAKLNEQYNYLTPAVYRQIAALEKQGHTDEAAALAQKTYSQAMTERAQQLDSELGYIERGWKGAKAAAGEAWDAFLNIGRKTTVADKADEQIKALEAEIKRRKELNAGLNIKDGKATADLERQLENAKGLSQLSLSAGKSIGEAVDRENKARQTGIDLQRDASQYATKAAKMQRELAEAEGKYGEYAKSSAEARKEYEQVIAGIREKYKGSKGNAGAISVTDTDLANMRSQLVAAQQYHEQLVTLGAGASELNSAERESLKISEQLKLATDAKTIARLKDKKEVADALGVQLRSNEGLEKANKAHQQLSATMTSGTESILQRAKDQEAANSVIGKGRTAIEEMTLAELERQMAEAQGSDRFTPQYIADLEARIAAQKRWVASLQQSDVNAITQRGQDLLRNAQELAKAYEDELALSGLTGLEREKIVAQRQVELKYAKEIAAIEKSTLNDTDKQLAKDKVYQAQRIESAATVAKATQNYNARTSEEINRSLTDALMRGFENGKGFAENFRDTVENMFNTLVLRPIISAIMTPVSMGINSVVQGGLNAVGVGGGGGGSGGFSMPGIPSFGGGGGNFAAGMAGGWAGFEGGIEMMKAGEWAAGGMQALGAATPYIGALIQIGRGNYGSGLGTAAGAYIGSIVPGIGTAIGAMVGGLLGGLLDGGARGANHSGAAYSTAGVGNDKAAERLFDRAGGDWYDDLTKRHNATLEKQLKSSLDGWTALYGNFGKYAKAGVRNIDLVGGFAVNGQYQDEDSYGYAKIIDKVTGQVLAGFENRSLGTNPDEAYKAYMGQFGTLIVAELKKADLPSWMRATLDSLGEEPNVEALQAAFQTIELIGRSFEELGKKITGFADMTDLAFESLIKASGGIEALNTNAGSFYQNFYSEDERKTATKKELDKQLKDLGVNIDLDADDAQAQFRKVVEDKLKASSTEEANSKALAEAFSSGGAEGLKDLAKTGAFKDWVTSTVGDGTADVGKLTADLENLAKTSTSLADFTAGVDKLTGSVGGTGKSSAETAAELLKLNQTFKAVTKTTEETEKAAADAAKAKEEEAKKKAEEAKQATDAAMSALQRAVDAERTAAQARIDVVQERIDAERALMDTLRDHVKELRGQVESTQAMAAAKANQVIDQALSAYRRTGYLPEAADIGQAATTASGAITAGAYRSRLDYEAAQLILANKLEVLHDAAGEQLSTDEMILEQEKSQVDYLDRLLKAEREALDVARGIDTRLLTSEQAWAEFRAALLKETGGKGGTGGSSGGGKDEVTFGPGPSPGSDRSKLIAAAYHKYDGTGDIEGLVQAVKGAGGTARDIAALGNYALDDVNAVLDKMGIPRFAAGGDHLGGVRLVGEFGPELEFTGPSRIANAQQTQQLFAGIVGGGDTAKAIAALQQLIYDIGRQQIVLLQSIEGLARKTDALGVKQRTTA